jgi:hypothetical protein
VTPPAPPRRLDFSGTTGGAPSGEGADGTTETTLPPWQAARLAVLLDALGGVAISDAERQSPIWLGGFEAHTVENIAEVIIRTRRSSISLS